MKHLHQIRANNFFCKNVLSLFIYFSLFVALGFSSLAMAQTNGKPYKVSTNLIGPEVVNNYQISPDGNYVIYTVTRNIYLVDEYTHHSIELYSVPITGGTPVKLNGTLPNGSDVQSSFQISTDSSYVVYLADQDTYGVRELYSVPITGGSPVKLNNVLASDVDIGSFEISANGTYVVYPETGGDDNGLYSVSIDGTNTAVRINQTPNGGTSGSFHISPNSAYVIFSGNSEIAPPTNIYSVPIGGETDPVKLNETPYSGFQFSPDGAYIVYISDDQQTDGAKELNSVPINGGSSIKLNDTPIDGYFSSSFFEITSDSAYVVYLDKDGVSELNTVPITGGTTVKHGAPKSDSYQFFDVSPNGAYIVYTTGTPGGNIVDDDIVDGINDSYSVPITGGTHVKLNGANHVRSTEISPDSAYVVYVTNKDSNGLRHIHSVPITGGTSVKLTTALTTGYGMNSGGFVDSNFTSPNSTYVFYKAAVSSNIFGVPITGDSTPVQINSTLQSGRYISNYRISPDSDYLVYLADQDTEDVSELFAVRLGVPPVIPLSGVYLLLL